MKEKKFNKLFNLIFLCFLVAVVSSSYAYEISASETTNGIYITNTNVYTDEENKTLYFVQNSSNTDITSNGASEDNYNVKYDSNSKTLTLNNLIVKNPNISTGSVLSDCYFYINLEHDISIVIEGDNVFNADNKRHNYCMFAESNQNIQITFMGNGSVSFYAFRDTINLKNVDLVINGGTINLNADCSVGGGYDAVGIDSRSNSTTINGGELNIKSSVNSPMLPVTAYGILGKFIMNGGSTNIECLHGNRSSLKSIGISSGTSSQMPLEYNGGDLVISISPRTKSSDKSTVIDLAPIIGEKVGKVTIQYKNFSNDTIETSEKGIKEFVFVDENTKYAYISIKAPKYTVTWQNYDGTELEVDNNLIPGDIPKYDGDEPTRELTNTTVYTFNGWTPEITPVEEDTIYTATYSESPRLYTVTWLNEDGTELEVDDDMMYGDNPNYNGDEPTKKGDAQYSYSFVGWDKAIMPVTEDVTYTAQYKQSTNTYKVTWLDDSGDELEVDSSVPYGTMPSFDSNEPSKNKTAQYTYTFNGWTPEITPVVEDVTYTAMYESELNTYTVRWMCEGIELEVDENVPYGTEPSFDGETPTKESTNEHLYEFIGWSPDVVSVVGDITYTAEFNNELQKYSIKWVDEDGTELEIDKDVEYGTMPSFDSNEPSKNKTAQYTYTFDGWTPEIKEVAEDTIYTATYKKELNRYNVTWVNVDGTILEIDELVPYGEKAIYDGETPTKESTQEHSYEFVGWKPEIGLVVGETTYSAEYKESKKQYTITYNDGVEEQEIFADQLHMVTYGENTPRFEGNPYRTGYIFAGWQPKIADIVTENSIYKAEWIEDKEDTIKKHHVTFDLSGGMLNGETGVITKEYQENETIILPAPTKEGYTFDYWKGSKYYAGDRFIVKEDHTLTAIWIKNNEKPNENKNDDNKQYETAYLYRVPKTGVD